MKKTLLFLLLVALFVNIAGAETKVRIMAYNMFAYPGNDAEIRNPELIKIFNAIKPDIISLNDVDGDEGVQKFVTDILGDGWTASEWQDAVAYEYALVFKTGMFEIVNSWVWEYASGKPTPMWEVKYLADDEAPHLFIIGSHMESGRETPEKRMIQAVPVIDTLKAKHLDDYVIWAGDMSVYTYLEPWYQAIMTDSLFWDPIDTQGAWYNNAAYAHVHTQSTRGGQLGGLDDRFDQILLSRAFAHYQEKGWGYRNLEGHYVAFGNDGQHFNMDINATPPENSYGQNMADALWIASDHLPVYMDFYYGIPPENVDESATVTPGSFDLLSAYPNPFNSTVQLSFSLNANVNARLAIYNVSGREVAVIGDGKLSAGVHNVTWNAQDLPGGIYFARLTVGNESRILKLVYMK